MRRIRVIPVLLIHKGGLVKSINFKNYTYVGDPINAVKLFNEKEVDEIAILDINASRENRPPDIQKIAEIASEAFMPLAYGGGITTIDQIKEIFYNGVEKVILNKSAIVNPSLISSAAKIFGNQSVVVSLDIKKGFLGGEKIFSDNGRKNTGLNVVQFAKRMEDAGAGELLINSIDRDGTYKGYNIEMIRAVTEIVNIPVIAMGGASSIEDFRQAVINGASAVAAGSMFVFQRPHKAVLISYPSGRDLLEKLYSNL
ncbi:MAG: AglZ/HisF2 family acetamidino modification protein [Agriterribacter sp.]